MSAHGHTGALIPQLTDLYSVHKLLLLVRERGRPPSPEDALALRVRDVHERRGAMAHGGRELARAPELARELDVRRVLRQVEHAPVASDIEDRVVVRRLDVRKRLRGRELGLHNGVLEELGDVVRESLDAVLVHGRVRALGRGEVEVVLVREDWEHADG